MESGQTIKEQYALAVGQDCSHLLKSVQLPNLVEMEDNLLVLEKSLERRRRALDRKRN